MRKSIKGVLCAVLAAAVVFTTPLIAKADDPITYTLPTTVTQPWADWITTQVRTEKAPSKDGVAEVFFQSTTNNTDISMEIGDGNVYLTTQTQADTGDGGAGVAWIACLDQSTDDAKVKVTQNGYNSDSTKKGIKSASDVYKVTAKVTPNASDKSKNDVTLTLFNTTKNVIQMEVTATGSKIASAYELQLGVIFGGIKYYGTTSPTGEKSASDGAEAIATVTPGPTVTPAPETSTSTDSSSKSTKKTMKFSSVKVKKGKKKITGKVSVKKATVKIKVGKKAYKKATVKGKSFSLKTSKLKKGTKVTIKATKSGYKTLKKTYTVK